jgi:hypothetical protein
MKKDVFEKSKDSFLFFLFEEEFIFEDKFSSLIISFSFPSYLLFRLYKI